MTVYQDFLVLLRRLFTILFLLLSFPVLASTTWEGFLDTYYAWDFNRPVKREFTTQPVRHNEPNINLAYGGLRFDETSWRGRFAIQGGNSVEANTLAERSDLRYIQESWIGYKAGDTWIDGGIYLAHIGAESWISGENWTYTRSLNLDYVPYYSAGIRITHENIQFHLMNGWQNIREDNQAKAIGLQYNSGKSFTYNNFFGDEEVVPSGNKYRPRFRGYHNFIFRPENVLMAFDLGHQSQRDNSGVDLWWAVSFTKRLVLSELRSMAFRIEEYQDPNECNVRTLSPSGFRVTSASVNFDQKFPGGVLWRTELRGFHSKDKIYPAREHTRSRFDGFLVTSLSILLK